MVAVPMSTVAYDELWVLPQDVIQYVRDANVSHVVMALDGVLLSHSILDPQYRGKICLALNQQLGISPQVFRSLFDGIDEGSLLDNLKQLAAPGVASTTIEQLLISLVRPIWANFELATLLNKSGVKVSTVSQAPESWVQAWDQRFHISNVAEINPVIDFSADTLFMGGHPQQYQLFSANAPNHLVSYDSQRSVWWKLINS